MVGGIPGSVKDSAKEFELLMLSGLAEPNNSTPYVHDDLRIALYIVCLLRRGSFEDFLSRCRRPNFLFRSSF